MIDFGAAAPVTGDLNVWWIHGTASGAANTDPPVQAHAYELRVSSGGHSRDGLPYRDEPSAGPRLPDRFAFQPDEPPLEMTTAQLRAVRDAARSVAAKPGVHRFDDFIIFNGPCRTAIVRQLARTVWRRVTHREGAAP